jgi:ABC-type glycerol-3-phosphate transport system permease component
VERTAQLIFLLVGGATMIVVSIAWVLSIIYMFKTVANRKPGIALWRDAPAINPFNHILRSENLTEDGLKYRRRLVVSAAAFVIPILITLGLAAITGNLG